MNPMPCLLVSCLAAISVGQAAVAEPEVGRLSQVETLDFDGNKTFTPAQIRSGLMSSFEFLIAAHPLAGRSNYLADLPELLSRGYRCAGFPDVQVSARIKESGSNVVVHIVEGRRLVQGQIVVRGAKTIPVAALIHELTNSIQASAVEPGGDASWRYLDSTGREVKPHDATWQRGEPFPFSQPLENYTRTIAQTLGDFGYFFPQITTSVVRHDDLGTADLLVNILEEGPHGTVREIVVTGVKQNSRAQLLQLLDLKEGMPIERDLVARCERKLWDSARFFHYSVTPLPLPQDTNAIRLTVDVRELSGAPALGREFSRAEQAMLRFRAWLLLAMRTNDLAVSVGFTNPAGPRQAFRAIISPRGVAVSSLPAMTSDVSRASSVVVVDGRHFTWFSPPAGRKLFTSTGTNQAFNLSLSLVPGQDNADEEKFSMSVGAGFGGGEKFKTAEGKSPMRLNLLFAPSAFVHLAHDTDGVKWDGSTLSMMVMSNNVRLRIDGDTGRLLQFSGTFDGNLVFDVSFQPGAFARTAQELEAVAIAQPNSYEARRPVSSSVGFMAQELLESPLVQRWLWKEADAPTHARAGAALQSLCHAGALGAFDALVRDWPQSGEVFYLPSQDPANVPQMMETLAAMVAARIFQLADNSFPRDSWPWVTAREAVFVFAGKPVFTERELGRLYESDEVGPIGFLALSKLLNLARLPAAQSFAVRGLDRLSLRDFHKDRRILLEPNTAVSESFTNTLVGLRSMNSADVDALMALVPRGFEPFLRSIAQPSGTTNKSLSSFAGALLDDLWKKTLRAEIARALTNSAGQALEIAAAEAPLAEAWKYFEGKEVPQDQGRAVQLFHEAARHQHPRAEFMLGTCYEQGLGVERDMKQAAQWYRHAAEHGVVEAQRKLGDWLSDGFTLTADYVEAYVWLSLAAMQGDLVSGSLSRSVMRKLTPEQLEQATQRLAPLAQKNFSLAPKAK